MEIIFRVIGYLILIALDVICFIFFHSHFLFVTLVILAVCPILSVLMALLLRNKVSVEIWKAGCDNMGEESFVQGEEMFVKLKISNPTPLLCLDCKVDLVIANSFLGTIGKQRISVPIRAFKGAWIDLPIVSNYCGNISIEVDKLLIKDFLGLCFLKKNISKKNELIVLPRLKGQLLVNRNTFSTGMIENDESTKRGSDYSEVSDIREYIPGDMLNNIHWKLTAKKDELMVKERTSMSDEKIVVLLELYNPDCGLFDNAISSAYTVINKLLDEKISIEFMYWSSSGIDFKTYKIDYRSDVDDAFSKMFFENTYERSDEGAMNLRGVHPEILRYVYVVANSGNVNVLVKENC